jgi:hypothetical protein
MVKCFICGEEVSPEQYPKHMDDHALKAKRIKAIIEAVKRPELRAELEAKYLPRVFQKDVTPKAVEEDIKRSLGIPVGKTLEEQWLELTEKLWNLRVPYRENSLIRNWTSDQRRYIQLTVWMDFGPKIAPLVREDHPESRFKDFEEADAYAATRGGYCSGIIELAGKRYWSIYVKKGG